MPALRDVLSLMEQWYPAASADDWDSVGLVCGDPDQDVRRILLAVDPVAAVAEEAAGCDLLVVHHPLFLKGTSSVATTTPKGRVVHRLVGDGCALFAAHTNADAPTDGVSESLALALGLRHVAPLEPAETDALDKVVVFAPASAADVLREEMTAAGAGAIGDYDSCTFTTPGEGRFRPLAGANPTIGSTGELEVVDEVRIEMVCKRRLRQQVVDVMLAVHPYEEPAYDVVELAPLRSHDRGSGRIGYLKTPTTLRDFADHVATTLPETAHGVRVAGDPDREVRTVALCGGAGDFLLDRARSSGADVYLTSDLRHHPASEFREHDGPALVDVAHWAAEWTWLPVLRRKLESALGDTVEVRVSTTPTDPWTFRGHRAPEGDPR